MSDHKHLTALEVDRLLAAAKGSRNEAHARCWVYPYVLCSSFQSFT